MLSSLGGNAGNNEATVVTAGVGAIVAIDGNPLEVMLGGDLSLELSTKVAP